MLKELTFVQWWLTEQGFICCIFASWLDLGLLSVLKLRHYFLQLWLLLFCAFFLLEDVTELSLTAPACEVDFYCSVSDLYNRSISKIFPLFFFKEKTCSLFCGVFSRFYMLTVMKKHWISARSVGYWLGKAKFLNKWVFCLVLYLSICPHLCYFELVFSFF